MILQTAGEGMYGVDLDGQLTFVNPAAARLLGWDVAALRGQAVTVMLPTDPPGAPLTHGLHPEPSLTPEGPPGGRPQAVPAVFRRKDGTTFPVEYITLPRI